MATKDEQAEYGYKIGLWLRPILDVIEKPADFDEVTKRRRRAQFTLDHQQLHNSLFDFCQRAMGVGGSMEWNDISHHASHIEAHVRQYLLADLPRVVLAIEEYRSRLLAAIAAVPVPSGPTTFEANSPFSTYCGLKSRIDVATKEIIYADRYVNESLFYRYLADVAPPVSVTVLTSPASAGNAAFLDVSRLYAKERPTMYRLLTEGTFHDRIAKIDDQLLLLGGSIKDAGHKSAYTLALADATNLKHLHDVVNSAQEIFGPTVTKHP